MTVAEAIAWGTLALQRSPSPTLDAEVLLAFVLQRDRAFLLSHPEDCLPTTSARRFRVLVRRRQRDWPVAYLTETREFFGLSFRVSRATLIPRPGSELLIEEALQRLTADSRQLIADIGTGSGCLGVSLAVHRPNVRLIATDSSPAALSVARENAKLNRVTSRLSFRCGDLLNPIADSEHVDLLVANLPYLRSPAGPFQKELAYEPIRSLDGGPDGLRVYRRLFAQLEHRTQRLATVLCELNPGQVRAFRAFAKRCGYRFRIRRDYDGLERVAVLTRAATALRPPAGLTERLQSRSGRGEKRSRSQTRRKTSFGR